MIRLVPVESAPAESIVEFLTTFPNEKRDQTYWRARMRHWWDDNPAFPSFPVRGWVLLDGERVVGFWGAVPQKYRISGSEVIALGMSTWRVAAEARNLSMGLLNSFVAGSKNSFAVNTTANEIVRKTLRAFRFQEAPTCFDDETGYLFSRGRHGVLRWLAPILNLPSFLLRRWWRGPLVAKELGAGMDSAIDQLWLKSRDTCSATIQRDSAFYEWFCRADTNLPKEILGLYRGGELTAILCFCRRDWKGRRELELLDVWPPLSEGLDSNAEVSAALEGALRLARDWQCDLVQIPHFSRSLALALAKNGVWFRRKNTRRHFYGGQGLERGGLEYRTGLDGDWAL